ncbi:hypothetical protein Bca101_082548 [Brassica carinata]
MANYKAFLSDLKSGKCSLKLCCMKDYEELAATVMTIVDCVVNKTREKIESSTDVLKGILRPVVEGVEEISWPPRDPEAINQMEKEMIQRGKEGQLDEGFFSEVSAQLRQAEGCFQAKKDKDKPGLAAMLQKVIPLYAAMVLSKRSYAKKGTWLKSLAHSNLLLSTNRISSRLHPITGNEVVKAEHFLETLIKGLFLQPYFPCSQSTQRSSHLVYYVFSAPEEQWNNLFLEGLTLGKGEVMPDELSAVIKKRIGRTLNRTEGGSYQQRILIEYLKRIESRANEIIKLLQG